MRAPAILMLYFLLQFMRRNLNFLTLPISKMKKYFSFTTHINSSETILVSCTCVVSYILSSIRLVRFGSPSITASFYVPLVSICAFFGFNYSCVTCSRMLLIPLLVTPQVSFFPHNCTLPFKNNLSCIDYPLRLNGVFPPNYQTSPSL